MICGLRFFKIFNMKKLILLSFYYTCIFLYFPYTYADIGAQDLHTQLTVIGDALNHQDFVSAKNLWDDLLKSTTFDEIAKTPIYYDFLMYLQLIIWNWDTDKRDSIIALREKYHPEDAKRASLLTRKDRSAFWQSNCTSLYQANIDTIDYGHCIIHSSKLNSGRKKKILFTLIPRYYSKVIRANDYQWMSDLSIFLAYYVSEYPEKSLLVEKYQKQLAKKILEQDPHWVNAYFIMLSVSEKRSERSYWISELKKNYIWDVERWKITVEPYINQYQ